MKLTKSTNKKGLISNENKTPFVFYELGQIKLNKNDKKL